MTSDRLALRNPFSTRYVRPGAIEFVFPAGSGPPSLIARLEQHGWWGQILGPHGSGKSTLLRTLIPELQAAGRTVQLLALRAGDRRLPALPAPVRRGRSAEPRRTCDGCTPDAGELPLGSRDLPKLIAVDGYEQLSWLARWRLQRWCRRAGAGLLVTTHRPAGLPMLWQTAPTLELALELVDRLLDRQERERVRPADVERAFRDCRGDLRETWFRLYDVYEQRT